MKALLLSIIALGSSVVFAQFDGAAGTPGSLAIHKDSNIIVSWANTCSVQRGWMDASNTSLGQVSHGSVSSTLGPADGGVLSLGDSGVAVLTFNPPIGNGTGPDFAVFENGFSDSFLELAFVEVSSNGVDFYRFPATSNYPTNVQIGAFDDIHDPTTLNNLAGKYRTLFGTPFDLSELDTISELDLNQITHVRIVDAVGSINPAYGTQDVGGNFVNDPFPTPFATGGFDLDAVAVIHQGELSLTNHELYPSVVYPNPVRAGAVLNLKTDIQIESIQVVDSKGSILQHEKGQTKMKAPLQPGVYFLHLKSDEQKFVERLIVQ